MTETPVCSGVGGAGVDVGSAGAGGAALVIGAAASIKPTRIKRHSTFHAQHETVAPKHNLSRGWTRPLGRDDRATRRQPPEVTDANGLGAREQLNRLAGEVHDGLAQHLTAISMQLSVAKEALSSTGGNPLCNIEQAIELAKLGLVEARRCAHNLCCSVFDESGTLCVTPIPHGLS